MIPAQQSRRSIVTVSRNVRMVHNETTMHEDDKEVPQLIARMLGFLPQKALTQHLTSAQRESPRLHSSITSGTFAGAACLVNLQCPQIHRLGCRTTIIIRYQEWSHHTELPTRHLFLQCLLAPQLSRSLWHLSSLSQRLTSNQQPCS